MRILIVTHLLGGFAGDASQMWHIAEGLSKRGHKVDIFTTDGNPWFYDKAKKEKYGDIQKKILNSKGRPVKIREIDVYTVPCTFEKFGMYSKHTTSFAKENIENYDVVYGIHWYNHPVMEFSKIAHRKNVPFILAAYGSLQDMARNMNKNAKRIMDWRYTKKMIKNSSGFHSVGELETEQYLKLGINKQKIHRIDHGVVLNDFIIKKDSKIFEKIGIDPKKERYLIFIGRIDKKKGIDVLIKSFQEIEKKIEDISLVVVGTGLLNYENEIKELVSKLNLNKIKFTGFVSDDEKLELLQSATLFITISHSDVHSIAIQEALVMGIPVIVSKASDWPEIDEYQAGITTDTDIKSVEKAIKKLLDQNTNLKEYSKNAKKLINEKFLIENLIPKYEEMFNVIIKQHKK